MSSARQPRRADIRVDGAPFAHPVERNELLDGVVDDARFVESFPRDRAAARQLAADAAHIGQELAGLNQHEYSERFNNLASALRSAVGGDTRQVPALAAYLVVTIELMRHRLGGNFAGDGRDVRPGQATSVQPPAGMEAADEAFRKLSAGTSRLVRLLADELVPLADNTLAEIKQTIAELEESLPPLTNWDRPPERPGDWLLEPPFNQVGVRRATMADFQDIENLERMRRSFDFLAPQSLALRKEAAIPLIDTLLDQLRRTAPPGTEPL